MSAASSTRRRVLFVEDEPSLRRAYERAFSDRYESVYAATGADALRQLEQFTPDVIVLDLRLPDTDGVDVLREIRAGGSSVPVLITTAYASMRPLLDVLGLGHAGFLLKPYDLDTLAERIDAAG